MDGMPALVADVPAREAGRGTLHIVVKGLGRGDDSLSAQAQYGSVAARDIARSIFKSTKILPQQRTWPPPPPSPQIFEGGPSR
jgi:hypothetical protein